MTSSRRRCSLPGGGWATTTRAGRSPAAGIAALGDGPCPQSRDFLMARDENVIEHLDREVQQISQRSETAGMRRSPRCTSAWRPCPTFLGKSSKRYLEGHSADRIAGC